MIRYEKLGYVELNVTDLERSRAFYEEVVGLQLVGLGRDGEVRFRCSGDYYTVVLHEAKVAGYKRSGWMLEDEAQFDLLHGVLAAKGVAWEVLAPDECEARLFSRATRMVEPYTGATLEFYRPAPAMTGAVFTPTLANIQRLGHVVFKTDQYDEALAFFLDVLNFRASDQVADVITLMRPFPTPFHHGGGLARAPRKSFHHVNFMVTEIDDVGRGFNRFKRTHTPIVYGPGRHPASGSVFLYFLDPDAITLEYSFGMEEFPEVDAREHRVLPLVPESSDSWGAELDPRMSAAGEIERYVIGSASVPVGA